MGATSGSKRVAGWLGVEPTRVGWIKAGWIKVERIKIE